jgi:hypothetical protein
MVMDEHNVYYVVEGNLEPDGYIWRDAAYYPSAPPKADAAFIVRAVNAHEALVAALEKVLDVLPPGLSRDGYPMNAEEEAAIREAEAALARAKAEMAE